METVSLKEHTDALREADQRAVAAALASAEKATAAALASAEKAVAVAETIAKEWRMGSNEWRQAMTDRERNFMPRSEFEQYKAATEKILNIQAGKGMGVHLVLGVIVTAAGFIATIIGLVLIFT